MPRTIRRRKQVDVGPLMNHYLGQRMLRERTEGEEGTDKKELLAVLAEAGEPTDEGHRRLVLDEPLPYVDPKGNERVVTSILRQRRVSQQMDELATMALLEKKKLLEKCTRTITVLDEEAVLAANYEGTITDKELAALYSESESFAFLMEYE